jgi:hypothetical protein
MLARWRVGVWTTCRPFLGAGGAEKRAHNPDRPAASMRAHTHPHTRRYNPDVQDAGYIWDVLK